jgi:hypothetical protein
MTHTTDETLRASASLSAPRIDHGEDFEVRVTITNISDHPVRLNALFLRYATLMLRIERADSSHVQPGPPPLPPRDDGQVARVELAPGASFEVVYHGGNYSPQRLPPGDYRVRFSHENTVADHGDWTGRVESAWLPLRVLE